MPFDAVSRSKGGQTTAEKRRRKALNDYYSDPVLCKYCGRVIEVKEGEKPSQVKRKTFCDRSCRASHVNIQRARKDDGREEEKDGQGNAGHDVGAGGSSNTTGTTRAKSKGNDR